MSMGGLHNLTTGMGGGLTILVLACLVFVHTRGGGANLHIWRGETGDEYAYAYRSI